MIDLKKLKDVISSHGKEFETYCNLLLKWNKTYNLTSIRDRSEIFEKHFLDSITPLPFIPKSANMLDIGSGGGFPAMPLKICESSLQVTLLDSNRKKLNFCEALAISLGLKNVAYQHKRIEEYVATETKFDVIISRATFSISKLIQYGTHLLKDNNSIIITMKSLDHKEELSEASSLISENGLVLAKTERYDLPQSKSKHVLLIFSRS